MYTPIGDYPKRMDDPLKDPERINHTYPPSVETSLSVIVITYNAGRDIVACLESVSHWAGETFIVDSFSTDNTIELCRRFTPNIVRHQFEGFAAQRNWALENLPLKTEWVFFLDQDEQVMPQLAEEIRETVNRNTSVVGFYIKRRFMFMGRWLKHGGYYPGAVLRLFKHRLGHVVDAGLREYVSVKGEVGWLDYDMIHNSVKSVGEWIDKHNRYADLEAAEAYSGVGRQNLDRAAEDRKLEGSSRLWVRRQIFDRLPLLVRPLMLFIYRYLFRFGFLDGIPGLIYCFLHDLWYPFLIDTKCKELRFKDSSSKV